MKLVNWIIKKTVSPFKAACCQGMIAEEGVTVMNNVSFGSEPYLITLKKNCRISSDVVFITHDGGTYAFRHMEKYSKVISFGKIVVGEGSFIGARSIIMPGVKIGKNCVVGAGSIVTKDIPDESVVCGVPARVICTLYEYGDKCLEQMQADFDEDQYLLDKKSYLMRNIK